jgi:hypothetical protein
MQTSGNIQDIEALQSAYHQAFNAYLCGIKKLINGYSLRELARLYPSMEWAHIRLASELNGIRPDDTANPYCLHQLRGLPRRQARLLFMSLGKANANPSLLRKAIREKKKGTKLIKTKTNSVMRSVWLLQRKMKTSDNEERIRLLQLINGQ